MPLEKIVHAIREHLSIIALTLQHDLDSESERMKHCLDEVHKIDRLLSLVRPDIGCPLEKNCPVLHPRKKR